MARKASHSILYTLNSGKQDITPFLIAAALAIIIFITPFVFAEIQIDSPKKQMSHGILAQNVKCKGDLELILKITDKTAACVKPYTANHLVQNGWGVKMQNETSFSSSNFHLAFLLNTRSTYYNDNLQLLSKNLHDGDYLFVIVDSKTGLASQLVQQAKSMCSPGVHVNSVVLYSKLQKILNQSATLPRGIDWVIYDYENGTDFSPEFTVNETTSLAYFDVAQAAIKKYNIATESAVKLMVTPPYGELQKGNWDWGIAAQHMDGIDVQTQRLVKDMPTFKDNISKIAEQIHDKSPETFSMIQFSLRHSVGTVEDTLNGINNVKDLRIDAFLIFYDQYSQNSQLEQFFSLLHR
jgi:hypothetical protein